MRTTSHPVGGRTAVVQVRRHPGRALRPPTSRSHRGGGPAAEEHASGLDAAARDALARAGTDVGAPLGLARPGQGALRGVDARGRHVVVRVVELPGGREEARLRQRLSDLLRLRHPGLVRVLEVVPLPGRRLAVTSELVEGADLAVVLGARGILTRSEGARLLSDVAGALACLHEAGLAHGDLSPSNVMVRTDGSAVLVDLVGGALEEGTEPWAAPERAAGGPATPASDVWSLGALMRTCAEGGALLGERLDAVLRDVLVDDPRERPGARHLAARAPQVARPGVIELPDGARLAAGALRAAAAVPTRRTTTRVASRAAARDRDGHRRRGQAPGITPRRLVVAGVLAGTALLAGTVLVAFVTGATGATGTPTPLALETGVGTGAQVAALAATGAPGSHTQTLSEVVVALVQARDEALEAGDPAALAATTVPGSPAARADSALLQALDAVGERVEGLDTRVGAVSAADVPGLPDGAVALAVTCAQPASTRVGADGARRTVPAQDARQVVLVLLPDPWRVLEVREPAAAS